MFLAALGAPLVCYVIYEFMQKRHIDEHKLIPLFAGVGSYGLLMVGLFEAGTPRGGYFGIEEGAYAFQHGEISFLMQLLGVVVCLGMGMLTAAVLTVIFKATIGIRVSDDDQAEGLDKVIWSRMLIRMRKKAEPLRHSTLACKLLPQRRLHLPSIRRGSVGVFGASWRTPSVHQPQPVFKQLRCRRIMRC